MLAAICVAINGEPHLAPFSLWGPYTWLNLHTSGVRKNFLFVKMFLSTPTVAVREAACLCTHCTGMFGDSLQEGCWCLWSLACPLAALGLKDTVNAHPWLKHDRIKTKAENSSLLSGLFSHRKAPPFQDFTWEMRKNNLLSHEKNPQVLQQKDCRPSELMVKKWAGSVGGPPCSFKFWAVSQHKNVICLVLERSLQQSNSKWPLSSF